MFVHIKHLAPDGFLKGTCTISNFLYPFQGTKPDHASSNAALVSGDGSSALVSHTPHVLTFEFGGKRTGNELVVALMPAVEAFDGAAASDAMSLASSSGFPSWGSWPKAVSENLRFFRTLP